MGRRGRIIDEWGAAAASSGWAAAGASLTGWGATSSPSLWGELRDGTGGRFSRSTTRRTRRHSIMGRRSNMTFGLNFRSMLEPEVTSKAVYQFTSGSKYKKTPPGWARRKLQNHERVKKWEEYSDMQKIFDPYRKQWHLLRELAENRTPPPRRHRMYDHDHDNDDRPEDEDYAFHPPLTSYPTETVTQGRAPNPGPFCIICR